MKDEKPGSDKNNISVEKILAEKKNMIDSLIEGYFPRKMNKKAIDFLCGEAAHDIDIDACQKSLADPFWNLMDRGGKRWRPVLFLLVAEALGGDLKKLEKFSVIPEIVHNGTLMIDDVEDMSELRRGKPCIHHIFGQDIAINAGNFMYYFPLKLLMQSHDSIECERLLKAYEIYIQEMINISFGQGMDIAWHRGTSDSDGISESNYMQMCAYKTGTLARMSAKIAAVLSGAGNETTEKIGKAAESIGIAFQIQDDILDITEPESIGKMFGNDIKEGKRTLMVIHALRKADGEEKKRLIEILDSHTDDMDERKEAIDIINKYDSVEYARNVAKKIVRESWKDVENVIPESDAKKKLKSFAEFLVERKC